MSTASSEPIPISQFLDSYFKGCSPSRVALTTAAVAASAQLLREYVLSAPCLITARDAVLTFVRRTVLKKEITTKIKEGMGKIKFPRNAAVPVTDRIPDRGLDEAELLRISKLHTDMLDNKFQNDHLSGAVYHGSQGPTPMYVKIFEHHLWTNLLFADYFGGARKMEGEVIQMGVRLFNGRAEEGNCAAMTSGGSESIAMALLAYRNHARAERGIRAPVVVCCQTVHPAFDKACEYFGIRLVKVPANPDTFQFDASEAAKYITDDTIALVGSAPSYAHGVVDPIADLAALAKSRGIGMHVDACVGGFFIQFLAAAVQSVVDFRVDGVSTISADIHKWGGTPKGASLVLYRDRELRAHQMFACSDFPGGLYCSMGPSGSKGGYTAALAWASLCHFGMDGYGDMTERVRVAAQQYRKAVAEIEGIEVMGNPVLSIVSIKSDYFDIYLLAEHMKKHGWWFVNLQFPPGIHLGLTLDHAAPGAMDALVSALKEGVEKLLPPRENRVKGQNISYEATLYGSSQKIPDRGAVQVMLRAYVAKTVDYDFEEKQQEPAGSGATDAAAAPATKQ